MVAEVGAADSAVNTSRSVEQSRERNAAEQVSAERQNVEERSEARESSESASATVSVSGNQPVPNPQADRVEANNEVTRAQLDGNQPRNVQREVDDGAIARAELASQETQNQIQEQSEDALKAQANQRPEVVLELLS